jgi:hypothetical protein
MPIKLYIDTVISPGVDNGTTILIKLYNGLHPSIADASSSSDGNDLKNPYSKKIEKGIDKDTYSIPKPRRLLVRPKVDSCR